MAKKPQDRKVKDKKKGIQKSAPPRRLLMGIGLSSYFLTRRIPSKGPHKLKIVT